MGHPDHSQDFIRLCQALGEDLDSPLCRELENHLAECPECRLVFDTVRQTVYLYRLAERPAAMPQEVLERVLKTLALKKDQSGSQSL